MFTDQVHQQSNLNSTESNPVEQHNDLPVTTQPVPESDSEELENEKRKKRKQDLEDCCCNPYYDPDEWAFYLFCQCFGWCCVQLGKCMESMLEGCGDCITSCCEGGDCCDCNCFN